MAINAYARAVSDRMVLPVARVLARLGATPNWLTLVGLMLTLGGVAIVLAGRPLAGALVIASSSFADVFDGAVARVTGSATRFGAFLDSTVDRVVDLAVFGAVAWLVRDDPLLFALTMVALGAAQLTSYVRAKAESAGWQATVGLIERAERLIIVLFGIGFPVLLAPAIWILAVGGLVTVAQRCWTVWRQAGSS